MLYNKYSNRNEDRFCGGGSWVCIWLRGSGWRAVVSCPRGRGGGGTSGEGEGPRGKGIGMGERPMGRTGEIKGPIRVLETCCFGFVK